MKKIGIYIHIPFCIKKCYYCDFISYSNKENKIPKYIQCIKKEIKENKCKRKIVKTIYIGGGTPSCIDANYIKEILDEVKKEFNVMPNAEITIEINPKTANEEKLKKYKEIGINRLSIGMQSINPIILNKIGRIHTFEDFKEVFFMARKIGFKNINIDMIIGLPSQNMEDMQNTIKEIEILNPEHVSVYSLILEEGTKLYNLVEEKKEILPKDELERNMYWYIKKELEKRGYIHYEISNFAKKGYISKHNFDCWRQKEYLGFGVAAHSYYNNIRYSNIEDLEKYIQNIGDKKFKENIIIHEKQTDSIKQKEYMLLGLRTIEGVKISEFEKKFKQNPTILFNKEIEKLKKEKLIDVSQDAIFLSEKGIDLANIVWEEFV